MKYRRIVFWQDMASPHQSAWIRALAEIMSDCEVIGVFQRELGQERIAIGWSPPDYGRSQILVAPDRSTMDELLFDNCEHTVHIFSGMVYVPILDTMFRRALSSRATIGILSEGRDWRGWWGALRCAHSIFNERSYHQKVDFVLAIGRVGTTWFSKCGYDPSIVFPFCYVVEKPEREDDKSSVNGAVTIVSVGRLIHLKRIDLLLESLAKVTQPGWKLEIIGEGEERPSLQSMSARLGLNEKVAFRGGMSNRQVRDELDHADVFVFTSREDGWGAVVNEALMGGVPVICSDFPGAADLVVPGLNGELFECDSSASLSRVLNKWIVKGPLQTLERERIKSWSRCIEGEAVARYFIQIMDYVEGTRSERPKAPWLSEDGCQGIYIPPQRRRARGDPL